MVDGDHTGAIYVFQIFTIIRIYIDHPTYRTFLHPCQDMYVHAQSHLYTSKCVSECLSMRERVR